MPAAAPGCEWLRALAGVARWLCGLVKRARCGPPLFLGFRCTDDAWETGSCRGGCAGGACPARWWARPQLTKNAPRSTDKKTPRTACRRWIAPPRLPVFRCSASAFSSSAFACATAGELPDGETAPPTGVNGGAFLSVERGAFLSVEHRGPKPPTDAQDIELRSQRVIDARDISPDREGLTDLVSTRCCCCCCCPA
jgi:hypothetical protein